MKVSSLTKNETIYLLDLYKELHKVEEQLDDYISNTAAPEVLNIKKNRESIKQSSEEATEILNAEENSKDTKKMINLLEEYLESSEEIEKANETTQKIMYVIDELLDKKHDIEEEIKSLESKTIMQINYDYKEVIDSNKCKIISSDKNLINRIEVELSDNVTYVLSQNSNNVTEELIKIVDEHMADKKIEEEDQLKMVQSENQSNESITDNIQVEEPKIESIEQKNEVIDNVIDLPVSNENNIPLDGESNPNNVIELPINTNDNIDENTKVDNNIVLDVNQNTESTDNYIPISDIIKSDSRIIYVDTDSQDKKVAKIPPQKKETVSGVWNYTTPIEFKNIEELNNSSEEQKNKENVVPSDFNIENFVTNKAA